MTEPHGEVVAVKQELDWCSSGETTIKIFNKQ